MKTSKKANKQKQSQKPYLNQTNQPTEKPSQMQNKVWLSMIEKGKPKENSTYRLIIIQGEFSMRLYTLNNHSIKKTKQGEIRTY